MKTIVIDTNDGVLSFEVDENILFGSSDNVFKFGLKDSPDDFTNVIESVKTNTLDSTYNFTFRGNIADLSIAYKVKLNEQSTFLTLFGFNSDGQVTFEYEVDKELFNQNLINLQFIKTSSTEETIQPLTPNPTVTPIITHQFDDTNLVNKINDLQISNIALTFSICFYVVYRIVKNILQ